MKYFVIEEERAVKPLYESNFPFVQKTRLASSGVYARFVKQFKFRKTVHLFVDDVDSYRALGGRFGARKVDRFRAKSYPTWSSLTGIESFFFPEFQRSGVINGGYFPDCYLITQIDHSGDLVTFKTELLQRADSSEALSEVTSVYFEYVKSWVITIDKETAKQNEKRSAKAFKKRLFDCNIRSLESAYALIDRILDANPHDSGIVRKSKAYDLYKFRSIAREMIKSDHSQELEYISSYFMREDIWNAAKHLYELHGDDSFYDVYDDELIHQLVVTLENLAKEAKYLANGIYNHSIDPQWAKDKMKELLSETKEADFNFNGRGDTDYPWKQFSDISHYIMGL